MPRKIRFTRWLPAVSMMAVIFIFSATPSNELPYFGLRDFVVKKTGHALGYAILSLCFLYALRRDGKTRWYWIAFLLSLLYAASDEFHQGFVPGRNPSPIDVGIDTFGAALALIFTRLYRE